MLKLLAMMVTMLWYQLLLSGESYLHISNFKQCLNRALACFAVYLTGIGIALTVSVLTFRNFPFTQVSLHQLSHCQLWPASSRAISSIMGTVNWVPLRPGACWRRSEDNVICHILLLVFLNPVAREEQFWPRGRFIESEKSLGFLASLISLAEACTTFPLSSYWSPDWAKGESYILAAFKEFSAACGKRLENKLMCLMVIRPPENHRLGESVQKGECWERLFQGGVWLCVF